MHSFEILPFIEGRDYSRREDIHAKYSGQRQGGISTPKEFPYVFVFTGRAGTAHGYDDGWKDGIFLYTGEGQKGDMKFKGGNKAIRDHAIDGQRYPRFSGFR